MLMAACDPKQTVLLTTNQGAWFERQSENVLRARLGTDFVQRFVAGRYDGVLFGALYP